MLVLGVDFETTGLDIEKDRIIEVGAVLWDVDAKSPICLLSEFLCVSDLPTLTTEIQEITGLNNYLLNTYGKEPKTIFERLTNLMDSAHAVIAHNGSGFDGPIFRAEYQRYCDPETISKTPWIDTSVDVDYPKRIATRKLSHLAAEHGFVNPFPHRAIFDTLTMLRILSFYDVEEALRNAKEEKISLMAHTTPPWKDGGESNEKAKARGFRFDGASKTWRKIVRKSQVDNEIAATDLHVAII